MPDLRAQFSNDPDESETAVSGLVEYEAFKPVDQRQISLFLRPAQGECHWVTYSTLLRMEGGNVAGGALLLFFTSLAVSIEGRNLTEIANAIAKGRCASIEQFDPARHIKPDHVNAPFVEHITTYAPEHPVRFKAAPEQA